MSELPKGWVETTIGELLSSMIGGASPKKEDYSLSGTLALNKGDIKENGVIKVKSKANYLPKNFVEKHASKVIQKGAILVTLRDLSQKADFLGLISTYRGSKEALITQGMYALETSECVINDLLVLYSNTAFYRSYVKQQKIGATQVHLRNEQFLNISFPLAPLAEQKRIVEKLDQVLAQVDTIKARLDSIPAILKRFRQSVLAAAVSGKLTEEWRSVNLVEEWESVSLETVANIKDPHPSHRTPPESSDGVPYIGIGDLKSDGTIDFLNARKVSFEVLKEHKKRYVLKRGDFVFGKIGTLGKATVLPMNIDFTLSANVILIQPIEGKSVPEYIMHFLSAPNTMEEIAKQSNSTSQAAFGIKKMKAFVTALPPLTEQTEIVRLVDQYFAFADTIEKQVQKAQQRVDKLTQSILAKAFRGELVSQDPNDEPAEELLKRIAAARAESEALTKAAKKVGKKK